MSGNGRESPQLPYTQPQSGQAQGDAHLHASGAFAQPHDLGLEQHDLGASQLSPQHDEQHPDEKIAIPAETMPAANRVSAEFFMRPLYHNPGGEANGYSVSRITRKPTSNTFCHGS